MMSYSYEEVDPQSRLSILAEFFGALLRRFGCLLVVLVIVGMGALGVYGTISYFQGRTVDGELPAFVQSGIERQRCPVDERVTAYQLNGGVWVVQCVGD